MGYVSLSGWSGQEVKTIDEVANSIGPGSLAIGVGTGTVAMPIL